MLHSGDNDSTGVIAGFCFGAMYGFKGVPLCNYNSVEYKKRLVTVGEKLHTIAGQDGLLDIPTDGDIMSTIDSLFAPTPEVE